MEPLRAADSVAHVTLRGAFSIYFNLSILFCELITFVSVEFVSRYFG